MKRKIAKMLLPLYAFVRSLASPFAWRILYYRRRFVNDDTRRYLRRFLKSSMDDATAILKMHPYKADMLWGLVDTSIPAKLAPAFFAHLPWGRDCDEYARMWSLWGQANGYDPREWIVYDPTLGIKKSHVVTTLSRGRDHWLMDKRPYGPRSSVDMALETLGLKYGDPVIVEYKWRREW